MSGIQTLTMGTVHLKAVSKEKLSRFYQEIVGLQQVGEKNKEILLGAKAGEPLIGISELDAGVISKQPRTGLYHTAFLLPTRKALAELFVHIAQRKYPLDGAGDHIFSEAIYFRDIEGNGIEIYADRPEAEWERDADGNLPMATNEVDIEGLLAEASATPFTQIAEDTVIGHVHLQAGDIEATEQFYRQLLGLGLMTTIPSARFFAAGTYHHHIGSNIWSGRNLAPRQENEAGLDYFSLHTPEYQSVAQKLAANRYEVTPTETGFFTEDPNGIRLYIGN